MTASALQSWKSLDERTRQWLKPGFTPTPPLNVWQWAEQHVDFGLVPNYDTPLHERYDADYLPFWKEPAECITDPAIKEVVALKCARAGGSENILLNPIRYSVAVRPQPTLYVTGDQLSAESMMEERIKRGLKAAKVTRAKLNKASETQHRIMFSDMDLFITWPKAKQAFKQRGYGLVLCDELSTWPEYSADMARKRIASYPFAHIVMVSSPDPQQKRASKDDPIFVEYKRGDQRKWTCTDPNGSPFVFSLGKQGGPGLCWDERAKREDETWDYDKVRESAHYVTDSGTVITEADRIRVVNAGRWVATNPNAPTNVRSYHVTAFMTPFVSFGDIAVAFLKAKAQGSQSLRVFVYEFLAEPWNDEIDKVEGHTFERRTGKHLRGTSPFDAMQLADGELRGNLLTVDVQKDHVWYLVRAWSNLHGSALVDWGKAITWDDVDQIAERWRCPWVMVDSGYRTQEVYEESLRRNYIPAKGDDRANPGLMPWSITNINPYEGTRRAREGETVGLHSFHSDTYKLMLLDRVRGDVPGWTIYRGIERDYIRGMTAEERGPTGWKRNHSFNHPFDLETMQITLAERFGYLSRATPQAESEQA